MELARLQLLNQIICYLIQLQELESKENTEKSILDFYQLKIKKLSDDYKGLFGNLPMLQMSTLEFLKNCQEKITNDITNFEKLKEGYFGAVQIDGYGVIYPFVVVNDNLVFQDGDCLPAENFIEDMTDGDAMITYVYRNCESFMDLKNKISARNIEDMVYGRE